MDIRRPSLPSSARAGLPIGHIMLIDEHRDAARLDPWSANGSSRDETPAGEDALDAAVGMIPASVDAIVLLARARKRGPCSRFSSAIFLLEDGVIVGGQARKVSAIRDL
jgi:hypothetical protein